MSIFSDARERNIAHRIAAHNENDHNLIENVMAYRMSASDRTKIKYCDMRHYTSPVESYHRPLSTSWRKWERKTTDSDEFFLQKRKSLVFQRVQVT